MKKISAYLSNYTAASSGFSEGRLKDDPGDGTGSGITVQTHNDFLYGFLAPIKKWLGTASETDESETASDVLTAIERAAGVANENVIAWSNTTTYAQDDHVMYLGVQFVSMEAANVGNNPIDTPRDAIYFREFWKWGKYNFGGAAGRNFQAYGVHLAGQLITGVADYVAIFGIGNADQYPLLDIIAPDVMGSRTLLDTKGRVPRCADATGGSSVAVGLPQEDQFQGHNVFGSINSYGVPTAGAVVNVMSSASTTGPLGFSAGIVPDGINGTLRTGSETRMKNYAVGLRSVLVLKEI